MLAACSSTGGGETRSAQQAATVPEAASVPPSDQAPSLVASDGCPHAPGPIEGAIVFGADANLYALDEATGRIQQLTVVQGNTYAYDPAWSPDGQTLAYTFAQPADDPNLSWLPVGAICGIDRATGNGRLLARGAHPLGSLTEAEWSSDGSALLLTYNQPRVDEKKQYNGATMTIIRHDLATGQQEQLATNAFSPTLSPDGRRLVFLQLDAQNQGMALMFAVADGTAVQPLPSYEPSLGLIGKPSWSPDGKQVVFTATGSQKGSTSPPQLTRRSLLDRLLGIRVAQAHGIPADLWIVDAATFKPRRITEKALDDPDVAWSPDGQRLAYTNGQGGVFVVDVVSGETRMLTDRGNYGGISWGAH